MEVTDPRVMVALAAIVLIGRILGVMKWETWILIPVLLACAVGMA